MLQSSEPTDQIITLKVPAKEVPKEKRTLRSIKKKQQNVTSNKLQQQSYYSVKRSSVTKDSIIQGSQAVWQ